jgi:hypothetical protein
MRTGLAASLALHAGAFALAFVTLPDFMRTHIEPVETIPVQLIDEAELSLKTSAPAAAPMPKPEPPEEKKAPEEKEPEPAPASQKEPEKEPEPAKEPEKKREPETKKEPEEKKEPEKKKPDDDLDLDALSALVDKSRKEQREAAEDPGQTDEIAEKAREAIGDGDRLTATDIDKMRAAVSRCWNASAIIGAPNPEKLVVVLDVDLNRDGSLRGAPRVANAMEISLSGNRFWKVAEQNAIRAVVGCQPYDFLDPARYDEWSEFQFNFDPASMAGF